MTDMRTRRQIEGLLSYLLDVQYIYEEYKMPPEEKNCCQIPSPLRIPL